MRNERGKEKKKSIRLPGLGVTNLFGEKPGGSLEFKVR